MELRVTNVQRGNETLSRVESVELKAYEIIVPHIDVPRDGIPRDRAHEILLNHEDFEDEPRDAEYALDRLLSRGWFYEVEGDIRITDPD